MPISPDLADLRVDAPSPDHDRFADLAATPPQRRREFLRACRALEVPVVPRGVGASLPGGSMPHAADASSPMAKNALCEGSPAVQIVRRPIAPASDTSLMKVALDAAP